MGKPCLEYCRSINDYDEKKAVHDARALTKAFNDWIGYEMIKVPEVGDIYDREIMNGMDVKYVAKVVSWVICFRNGRACEKASVE